MKNATAKRIMNTRKVGALRISFHEVDGWLIEGRAVNTGYPEKDWVAGQMQKLHAVCCPTLEEAAKAALVAEAK